MLTLLVASMDRKLTHVIIHRLLLSKTCMNLLLINLVCQYEIVQTMHVCFKINYKDILLLCNSHVKIRRNHNP